MVVETDMTMAAIGRRFGVAGETVARWARARGIRRSELALSDDHVARAATFYRAGAPIGRICAELGVGRTTVLRLLAASDLDPRVRPAGR